MSPDKKVTARKLGRFAEICNEQMGGIANEDVILARVDVSSL